MKILQIINKPQLRGVEVFTGQLSAYLTQLGHEVIIVSLYKREANIQWNGKLVALNRNSQFSLLDIVGWRKLAHCIRSFRPDIVQANAGDTLKFAILSKLFFRWRSPVVFRNASMISSYIQSPFVRWFYSFLFKQTAYVISVTGRSRFDFLSMFSFMKNRIEVVPIGINQDESMATTPKKNKLLHVGGFTFEKNHVGLLSIIKRMKERGWSIDLDLIGDGPLRGQIQELVVKMELQKNVRFLGSRNDVIDHMRSARALLLPSLIEGLPGVILEAMYCRTPVVAYDVGGISEILEKRKTGWLVDFGNEEGFVMALEEVLGSGDHTEIVENAYDRVVSNFNNRIIANRFVEVYQKLA